MWAAIAVMSRDEQAAPPETLRDNVSGCRRIFTKQKKLSVPAAYFPEKTVLFVHKKQGGNPKIPSLVVKLSEPRKRGGD